MRAVGLQRVTGGDGEEARDLDLFDRAHVRLPRECSSICSTRRATEISPEDTYRVLAAVDSVVMVLDVAKGIEPQTLKLFEVCQSRNLPVITFLNKYDRPGRAPLELLDEIEEQIGLRPTPATWPVGIPGDFRGVIDRTSGEFTRFTRTVRGSAIAPEEVISTDQAAVEEGLLGPSS